MTTATKNETQQRAAEAMAIIAAEMKKIVLRFGYIDPAITSNLLGFAEEKISWIEVVLERAAEINQALADEWAAKFGEYLEAETVFMYGE